MSRIEGVHIAESSSAAAPATRTGTVRAVVELTKPGIVRMVVVASSVGFVLGAIGTVWTPGQFFLTAAICLLGTALSAAGANALNQVIEARRDARMARTAGRPVPDGRLSARDAWFAGLAFCVVGDLVLAFGASPAAALVALLIQISYLGAYTPLKAVTPLSTIVGSLPGALPPLVGWTAAASVRGGAPFDGLLEPGGWSLVALMFVWQVPHVLAISWKYREQYAAGGYRVLPSVDPTGVRTGTAALLWSLALIPVSLVPIAAMPGVVSLPYAVVAFLAGGGMVLASAALLRTRTSAAAMRLFFVSIAYLPLVLLTMVVDAFAGALLS